MEIKFSTIKLNLAYEPIKNFGTRQNIKFAKPGGVAVTLESWKRRGPDANDGGQNINVRSWSCAGLS